MSDSFLYHPILRQAHKELRTLLLFGSISRVYWTCHMHRALVDKTDMSMWKAPTKYAAGVTVPKKPTRREKATNQNDSLLKACTGKNGASFLSWASIVLRLRIRAIPRSVTARFVHAMTLNRTGCTGQLALSLDRRCILLEGMFHANLIDQCRNQEGENGSAYKVRHVSTELEFQKRETGHTQTKTTKSNSNSEGAVLRYGARSKQTIGRDLH